MRRSGPVLIALLVCGVAQWAQAACVRAIPRVELRPINADVVPGTTWRARLVITNTNQGCRDPETGLANTWTFCTVNPSVQSGTAGIRPESVVAPGAAHIEPKDGRITLAEGATGMVELVVPLLPSAPPSVIYVQPDTMDCPIFSDAFYRYTAGRLVVPLDRLALCRVLACCL